MSDQIETIKTLETGRSRALKIAAVGAIASVAGFFMVESEHFFHAYLMAFIACLSIAGGSIFLLCVHHLVSGRWGFAVQRMLEAGARTMPLCAIMALPLLLGLSGLYEWTDVEHVAHDHLLHGKAAYLNVPFFLGRAVFYFAIWLLLSHFLTKWSAKQDETGDPALELKMRKLSGIGLLLYGLTTTFASFDWMMSLEPHWFSSVYGASFMISQALVALAVIAIVGARLCKREPLKSAMGAQQFHDVGNLLWAATILWAYLALGQFIIIWSGDLPEETFWYLERREGGWEVVSVLLAIVHFVIPFLLMLFAKNKRRPQVLARIAAWLFVVHFLDLYWQIAPTFHKELSVHVVDIALPVALLGVWTAVYLRHLSKHSLVPLKDPRFPLEAHN